MTDLDYQRDLQERLSKFQQRYDEPLAPFNRPAPQPKEGEGVNAYRRRALSFMQAFLPPSSQWRDASLDGLKSAALNVVDQQIMADVRVTAARPELMALTPAAKVDTLDPAIRMVKSRMSDGSEQITFHGESFVRAMGRPGRLVTSFTTDRGRYKPGRGWF
jgi:hypothetical protein